MIPISLILLRAGLAIAALEEGLGVLDYGWTYALNLCEGSSDLLRLPRDGNVDLSGC